MTPFFSARGSYAAPPTTHESSTAMNRPITLAGALLAITIFAGCASTEEDDNVDTPTENTNDPNNTDPGTTDGED